MFAKRAQGIYGLILNGLWTNILPTQDSNSYMHWPHPAHPPESLPTGNNAERKLWSRITVTFYYDGYSNQELLSLFVLYITSFYLTILYKFSPLVIFSDDRLPF